MVVLYTSSAIACAILGFCIMAITRYTLGWARTGGYVLAAIGTAHVGLGYTILAGNYNGVGLLCTLVSFVLPYWMYVRERLATNTY